MFPCTGCGLCCQHIGGVEALKTFDLGNGICKYFDALTKECRIYEERPLECRVDEMYEKVYHTEFSKEVFYNENARICNQLQEHYNLDESFRVKIGE